MIEKYILVIILGCIAGAIIIWAFDSFVPPKNQNILLRDF
jgi:hypothetical protein